MPRLEPLVNSAPKLLRSVLSAYLTPYRSIQIGFVIAQTTSPRSGRPRGPRSSARM